jgi:hypothetical protein
VATAMIAKYGAPNEITEPMLIWHDNGVWKRTIVHREEVAHDFRKRTPTSSSSSSTYIEPLFA